MNSYHLSKIKRHFTNNSLVNVNEEVSKELLKFRPFIKPGRSIALAVGSRGIANLALVVKETVKFIKENNAYPFIIPAMGSQRNSTAKIITSRMPITQLGMDETGARALMNLSNLEPELWLKRSASGRPIRNTSR